MLRWIKGLRSSGVDDANWRGAVTDALVGRGGRAISTGCALDAIAELKRYKWSQFRVTDGKREGWCYSFWGHFNIHWDDGEHQRSVVDLSYIGVRKTH